MNLKKSKIYLQIRFLKIVVCLCLMSSMFLNFWTFELYETSTRGNYNTLRGYINSRNVDLSWYDKFVYQEPTLSNGFHQDRPDKIYHIIMYSHILFVILSVIIMLVV